MLTSNALDECDDCAPSHTHFGPKAAFSTVPFIATFALVTFIAYRKVHPLLSAPSSSSSSATTHSTTTTSKTPSTLFPPTLPPPTTYTEPSTQRLLRRFAALTFSSTLAFSTVLTELLLCEISNSFNPTARSVALQVTVASLLGLLVIAIPLLGIHTVVTSSGTRIKDASNRKRRVAWVLEAVGYACFLGGFWALGALLPETSPEVRRRGWGIFQACLDRLGITGVTLMALLSGFASVSAIWQNFGPKPTVVAEQDVVRRQNGLEATVEMLREKRWRLGVLRRRMEEQQQTSMAVSGAGEGMWGRVKGAVSVLSPLGRDKDVQERQTLEMEVSGLETMASSLESSLSVLKGRRADQLREKTALGRAQIAFGTVFACYCVYRILATSINIFRRTFLTTTHNSTSQVTGSGNTDNNATGDTDPITYFIALFARHIYPSIDQASWAHQISFLLSGIMLFASFNAVTQTFYLFARILPSSLLHATRTNFALLISQISGMYVISSALMLRGMMPQRVGSVIEGALGTGVLETRWVGRWFEGWFAVAVVVTAVGIGVSRSWRWDLEGEGEGWERGGVKGA